MSPGSIGPSRRESASRVRAVFPAVYTLREFAEAAGLVAYSTNFGDLFREAAGYIDRVLKGARPRICPCSRRRLSSQSWRRQGARLYDPRRRSSPAPTRYSNERAWGEYGGERA